MYRNSITSKNIQYSRKDFLKRFYILIFRKWRKEGERKRKKPQCVVASPVSPTGDLAHNLGTCPDWESNQQPFDSQASTQSTEPHQPGLTRVLYAMNAVTEQHLTSIKHSMQDIYQLV